MTVRVVFNRFDDIADRMAAQSDRVARKAAFEVERYGKHFAPVDTGNLESSIHVANKISEAHYEVLAGAEYAAAVEYGSDHGSYVLPAQPFMRPAIEQVKPAFMLAMRNVIEGRI